MKNNKDLAAVKRAFDVILAYEKTLNTPIISTNRVLDYFGEANICKIYNCAIVSDKIAYSILTEVFKDK